MTFKNVNLEEVQVHPLFTVDEDSDDDEIKTVTSIHVVRFEQGKRVFAPRPRAAGELTSLEQIHAEFGGGDYELIGYNNGRISTRKKITLPGKPKPMFDEGIEPPTPTSQAPTTTQFPIPQANDPMMSMVMMMMQGMMQQQAQAAQSQTQMFIAMMQGNQQSSAEEKAQARAELQANIERERISSERTMGLMREMMQHKPGGGEGFTQGAEFMRSIMTNQLELIKSNANKGDGDWDLNSILETIGQVVQGASLIKGMSGPLPEGAPGIAEVAEAAQ